MINSENGNLTFDSSGERIGPSVDLEEFLQSEFGMQFQKLVDNSEWCSFSLSIAAGFDVQILFRGSRLVEVHLALASESPQSWSDWSEAKEGIKKKKHDEFLMQELGHPHIIILGEQLPPSRT